MSRGHVAAHVSLTQVLIPSSRKWYMSSQREEINFKMSIIWDATI